MGLMTSSFVGCYSIASVCYGIAINHYPKFLLLCSGLVIWVAALFMSGLAYYLPHTPTTFGFFICARSLSGVGEVWAPAPRNWPSDRHCGSRCSSIEQLGSSIEQLCPIYRPPSNLPSLYFSSAAAPSPSIGSQQAPTPLLSWHPADADHHPGGRRRSSALCRRISRTLHLQLQARCGSLSSTRRSRQADALPPQPLLFRPTHSSHVPNPESQPNPRPMPTP